MAFPWGFNFRSSLGYVTDPSGTVFVNSNGVSADVYPTSKSVNGDTVDCGWDATTINGADRDSTVADKKLAGIGYCGPTETRTFRVDLPSTGTYRIRLALGDASGAQGPMEIKFYDDSTLRGTVNGTTGGALRWFDATDVERTSVSDWTNNNAQLEITMATTTFKATLSDPTGYTCIAHLEITQVAAGTNIILPLMHRGMDDMGRMAKLS